MSETFSLIVEEVPECLVSRGHAAKHIAQQFNMSVEKALAIMDGDRRVVSRGLDLHRAKQYAAVFDQAGVAAQVVEDDSKSETRSPLSASDVSTLFQGSVEAPQPKTNRDWLIAGLLCCIPLGYVAALIGSIGLTMVYASQTTALSGGEAIPVVFQYALPLCLMVLISVLLARPFLGRLTQTEAPYKLSPEKEPLLFALIHEICERGGIRPPMEIQLNCRVNLALQSKAGWSGLISKETVLTIGLPLIAGLTLRQFAGVLAHELGHYRETKDPRVSFLIYRVNRWLYRRSHEADSVEVRARMALQKPKHNPIQKLILLVSAGSRYVFTGLLWIAKRISFKRLRDQEFMADDFQSQIAGTDEFRNTTLKMHLMHLAYDQVLEEVAKSSGDRGLPENFPGLVITRANKLKSDGQGALKEQLTRKTTQIQGLHPADSERIQRIESNPRERIMIGNGNVASVFENFDASCRTASTRLYNELLNKRITQSQLIANAQFDPDTARSHPQYSQLNDYFLNLFCPSSYISVGDYEKHLKLPRSERVQQLHQLCSEIRRASPEARKAVADYVAARQAFFELAARNKWLELDKKEYEAEVFETLTKQVYSARAWLRDFERPYTERLELSLAAALSDAAAEGSAALRTLKNKVDPLIATQQALVENQNLILEVYRYAGQGTVAETYARENIKFRGQPLIEELERLNTLYEELRSKLNRIPYPLPSPAGQVSVLEHLEWHSPTTNPESKTSVTWKIYGTLSGLERIHIDVISALTRLAQQAESDNGVKLKLVN